MNRTSTIASTDRLCRDLVDTAGDYIVAPEHVDRLSTPAAAPAAGPMDLARVGINGRRIQTAASFRFASSGASPAGVNVMTIRTARNGPDHVRIEVEDPGAGIAPENVTRIFSPGVTTRTHSHGFGLHSGALTAREPGGSLTAKSDGPGRGAVITLLLPIAIPSGET